MTTSQGIRACTVLVVVMPGCSAISCCADIFRDLFPLHLKLRRLDLSHNVNLNLSGQHLHVLIPLRLLCLITCCRLVHYFLQVDREAFVGLEGYAGALSLLLKHTTQLELLSLNHTGLSRQC